MKSQLTERQRKLVEKNHNLIYKFAYQHKLPIDDYYDLLAISLCEAAKKYDESRGAFSTFAYTYMMNSFRKHYRHIHTQKYVPDEKMFSYDNNNMIGYFADDNNDFDDIDTKIMFDSFCNSLTKKEKEVAELLFRGASQAETAEALSCSRQNINGLVSKIQKKFSNYLDGH